MAAAGWIRPARHRTAAPGFPSWKSADLFPATNRFPPITTRSTPDGAGRLLRTSAARSRKCLRRSPMPRSFFLTWPGRCCSMRRRLLHGWRRLRPAVHDHCYLGRVDCRARRRRHDRSPQSMGLQHRTSPRTRTDTCAPTTATSGQRPVPSFPNWTNS